MHIYIFIYIYIYIYIYICMFLPIYKCIYIYIYICMYIQCSNISCVNLIHYTPSLDPDSAIELHSLLPSSGGLGNHVDGSEDEDGNFVLFDLHAIRFLTFACLLAFMGFVCVCWHVCVCMFT